MATEMRTCRYCGTARPLLDFRKQHNGDRAWKCLDCRRSTERSHREKYLALHAQSEFERLRRLSNTPKAKARDAVRHAVQAGRITKPAACERCGQAGPVAGHHEDYSRPLDVNWYCRTCHERVHQEIRRAA